MAPKCTSPVGTHTLAKSGRYGRRRWFLLVLTLGTSLAVNGLAVDIGSERFISELATNNEGQFKRAAAFLSTGDPKPPQPPLVYGTDTVESLQKALDKAIADEKAVVETIIKNTKNPEDATFDNTLKPYAEYEQKTNVDLATLGVYSQVSPNKDLANISRASSALLDESTANTSQNKDYFARVDYVYQKQKKQPDPKLSSEDYLFLEKLWLSFQDNGLHLPDDKLKRFKDISKTLSDRIADFSAAVVDDNTTLWFTKEELNGTKPDVIAGLLKGSDKNAGKLGLSLSNPDSGSVSAHATNETTRRLIEYTDGQMSPSNVDTILKIIRLRDERARLLNYSSFAEQEVRDEMAKTPAAVEKLLQDVRAPLKTKLVKEVAMLKDKKKKEIGKADHLFIWDQGYYSAQVYDNDYKLDVDYLKQWFPADYMFAELLKMYEEIYALKFIPITGKDLDDMSPTKKGSDLFWAPNMTLYAVWDEADDTKGQFIGYLSVDLYYREGKNPGAYMYQITDGFTKPDGSRHYPNIALACNFKLEGGSKPQLIQRSEIQTILHETGHAMHGLTSRTKYGRFHGVRTPRDWVEMPSQLMENWSYMPVVLKRLSKHWSYLSEDALKSWQKERKDAKKDTKQPEEKFPDDLIKQLLASKTIFSAGFELRQAFYSSFDYELHDPKSAKDLDTVDPTALYNKGYKEASGTDGFEVLDPKVPGNKEVGAGKGFDWGHPQTQFTHIFSGGYPAKYYGYTWSRINAKDVFYTHFEKDPFSRATGSRWRKIVLEPGGTKDYDKILEEFLGRKPNNEAFLKELGVDV